MKKLLAILLALILVFSLTACVEESSGSRKSSKDTSTSDDSHDDDSFLDDTPGIPSLGGLIPPGGNAQGGILQIDFEEVVVVDNDECRIKVTKVEALDKYELTMKVQVENKSEDTTYAFSLENTSVNGLEYDPYFYQEVNPGKKANQTITFYDDMFEDNGIVYLTDIKLTFRVYDSETWGAEEVANETVHIYPYGEENANTFVRESTKSDVVLVDNEEVTVIVTGYDTDEWGNYAVKFFLVNKTDSDIEFYASDTSINSYMIGGYFNKTVHAGNAAFGTMSFDASALEENEIDTIEEIEFKLRALSYYETWQSIYHVDEVFVVEP